MLSIGILLARLVPQHSEPISSQCLTVLILRGAERRELPDGPQYSNGREFHPCLWAERIRGRFGSAGSICRKGITTGLRGCVGLVIEILRYQSTLRRERRPYRASRLDFQLAIGRRDVRATCPRCICYDFKGRTVIPTHYAIESAGRVNPKLRTIEASTDGENWVGNDYWESSEA